MRKNLPTVLVLWSHRGDELITVTFVTLLRQAGLRVKLVGIDGLSSAGRVGIVIKADRVLAQAVQAHEKIVGIVLPGDETMLRRFGNDERLRQFLQQSVGALWVVSATVGDELTRLLAEVGVEATIHLVRAEDDLRDFVGGVVEELGN